MINIGLIGCGVIGDAMRVWLQKNGQNVSVFVYDPQKGYVDDVFSGRIDAYFIAVNVKNDRNGHQDIENIDSICLSIRNANKKSPIWIRSTITPHTFKFLDEKYHVNYMPEFLTERTSVEDFTKIPVVYTPSDRPEEMKLLKRIFNNRDGVDSNNLEAIYAKYFHNIFGAMKVTYFNCLYDMCQENGLDFSSIKNSMFISGHISKLYTDVPGPDGRKGYGGKCFPKDTVAFLRENKASSLSFLLGNMPILNKDFRGDEYEDSATGWEWFSR